MLIRNKIATTVATGAILLSAFTPAFGATVEVTGNGSSSANGVAVSNNQTTSVVQTNTATVTNTVTSNANSGGNDANDNTGGAVTIRTGNAANTTAVRTQANTNVAHVDGCSTCAGGVADVLISGNGSASTNTVGVAQNSTTSLFQNNTANVANNIDSRSDTGHNDANRNTGGDVAILTGSAVTVTDVRNDLNRNHAVVGGGATTGTGAGVAAVIRGNGSGSVNSVGLSINPVNTLVQTNAAYITNDVDSRANSGHNYANDNTGGAVTIDTLGAAAGVAVDNMANFNHAAIADCSCLLDTWLKVAGNGSFSHNGISADLGGSNSVFQTDLATVHNPVYAKANTGYNGANRNTGAVDFWNDPYVGTGMANSLTTVTTKTNVNEYHQGTLSLPGNTALSFNVNFGGLLGGWWPWGM